MNEEIVTESTEVIADSNDTEIESQNIQDETNDNSGVWDEEFDVNDGEPSEESVESDEPNKEPENTDSEPEYITAGLGDLEKPIVIKYKGKKFDITSKDQIRDLMERGMGATQKLQELAEMRKELALKDNPELTDEQLQESETNESVERISQEILDSDIADDFKQVLSVLPEQELGKFRTNPKMLQALQHDVASGLAQQLMPEVEKRMALENMSFDEAYMAVGIELMESNGNGQVRDNKARKLGSIPSATTSIMESKPKDIWDLDDKEYKSLMDTERR